MNSPDCEDIDHLRAEPMGGRSLMDWTTGVTTVATGTAGATGAIGATGVTVGIAVGSSMVVTGAHQFWIGNNLFREGKENHIISYFVVSRVP